MKQSGHKMWPAVDCFFRPSLPDSLSMLKRLEWRIELVPKIPEEHIVWQPSLKFCLEIDFLFTPLQTKVFLFRRTEWVLVTSKWLVSKAESCPKCSFQRLSCHPNLTEAERGDPPKVSMEIQECVGCNMGHCSFPAKRQWRKTSRQTLPPAALKSLDLIKLPI